MTVEQCETCKYNNERCKVTTLQMYKQIKTNMPCGDYEKEVIACVTS